MGSGASRPLPRQMQRKGIRYFGCLKIGCGNYLTSRRGEPQVLSAQESLTSVFGMRTGGSSPLSSPQWLYSPLSRDIYLYDQFPLSKRIDHIFRRLSDLPLFRRGLPPCLKADNCIGSNSEKFVRSAVSVLVEIFVPYFRFVFVSFYLVFEIKPSTY